MHRFTPVSDQIAQSPSPNDWLMWRRTYNSWGHSPLNQINTNNVGRLQLAWAWTQEPGNQEAAPLVRDGVMYLAQSNNVVHALDATNGTLIWEYRHPLPELKGSYVKRQLVRARNSIALYDDRVFLATGDARLVALDARTGKVVWNVQVADYNVGFNYTAGPLVVRGKVIAGISGCTTPDTGGGCFLTAHDAQTGRESWRTYSIARDDDPNAASWNGVALQQRKGGSMWGTGSYDPELNLIFWGTAPPIPLSHEIIHCFHVKQVNSRLSRCPRTDDVPPRAERRRNAEHIAGTFEYFQDLFAPFRIHTKEFHATRFKDAKALARIPFHKNQLTG